jgi:hypothetical protein
MDIGRLLGIFIAWPFLALIPAAFLLGVYAWSKTTVVLVAGLAWLAYFPYELAMKLRILCSGECNIRVDLLVLYPVLAVLSVIGLYAFTQAIRKLSRA